MFGKERRENAERPKRTATPIGGSAGGGTPRPVPSTRLGDTTLEFFKEGERHEAAGWADTPLPPDDEPDKDPKIKFKSFDKIAKKRSSTVALLAISVGLSIAVAVGVVAALRTEHVMSSSLGSYFGFGGRASGAKPAANPAALPPPILIPDAGLPSTQPQGTDMGTSTDMRPYH